MMLQKSGQERQFSSTAHSVPSALRVEIVDTITAVSEAAWDAVAGENLFHTHRWQRVMESHLCNCYPHYVLVYCQEQLVAVAIDMAPPPPYFLVKKLPACLRLLFERVAGELFTYCAAPLTPRLDGIIFRRDVTDTFAITTAVLAALDRRTYQHKRFIQVYVSTQGDESRLHKEFTQRGYTSVPASSYATLEIGHYGSFAAYLQALPRKRRKEIRRQLRRANERGVTISHLRPDDVTVSDEDLYRLFNNVLVHHGVSQPSVDRGFFSDLRAHLAENAVFFIAHVQDRFVGFVLGLHDQHTITFPVLGLDYALAREYGVYFLFHYEMIRHAIENGFRALCVGATTLDVKRRLGYQTNQRYYFIRSSNRFLDHSLQTLLRYCQTGADMWLGKDL